MKLHNFQPDKQRSVQLEQLKVRIKESKVPYPANCNRIIPGFDGRNLHRQAACLLATATASLAVRIIMRNRPSSDVAADMLRNSFVDTTQVSSQSYL